MGKIKPKQVKRGIQELLDAGIELSTDFEMNKKILGREMPSKKMRNKMAGHASRHLKQKEAELASLKK
ncbi:MAG: 30S ribosomal protein S17e [Nanoarchaeota archaeon]|jgi:ribosomal protein S17E|nr:30S ribosomal protein S17e [Nanoarchaeota archaeon]